MDLCKEIRKWKLFWRKCNFICEFQKNNLFYCNGKSCSLYSIFRKREIWFCLFIHNKKNIYAIKAISRKSVELQKMLSKYFVNERRIMLTLNHPFIVKLVKTMKNNLYCFLLIEFVNDKKLNDY